jgi:NodT family efflux transporter outer membrane factor (OMF) lipoprotein
MATNWNEQSVISFRGTRLGLLAALSALVLLVSGCALSKPPIHTDVVNAALPQGTTIPTEWSSDTGKGDVANDWLKSFNDNVLDALVAEALRNNLDLRQSARQVEMARQSVEVVGSQLYPQVGAELGFHTTVAEKRGTSHEGSKRDYFHSNQEYAGVYWELDLWGRLRAQREASEADFQATALDYAFARQSLAATVAKSWYLTIETRQLLELAEQAVSIYSDLADLVKVRRAAGKVADLDVAEANGNLSAAEDELSAVEAQYNETRRALELLLGRYPAAELEVAQAFVPVPPPVTPGLPASLLERRPDLVAAERQVVAAFRLQEASKLALLPTISLALEGGHLSNGITSLLRLNPWMFRSAIGMSVPVYTGGALSAQIKIATAQQEKVIARYGSVALQAFSEVETALTNEVLFAQRLRLEEKGLGDRTEAVRIARIKYTAGAMDMLPLLQLQERQLESKNKVIKMRNSQLANRINLHLALGGSFESTPAAAQKAHDNQ